TGPETPLTRLIRSISPRNVPEVGSGGVGCRIGKIRVIQRVQRLRPDFELSFLRDRECPGSAHIHLPETRTAQVVSAGVSEPLGQNNRTCWSRIAVRIADADIYRLVGCRIKVQAAGAATLGRDANATEDSDDGIDLIGNLSASACTEVLAI